MDDGRSSSRGKSGASRKRSQSNLDDGRRKRQNLSLDTSSSASKAVDTTYRILCPIKKIGSVLGKGGVIINALRDETHAKIRVADAIPGADERVIIIFNYQPQQLEKVDADREPDHNTFSKKNAEDMQPHCPAHDALLKVHDKIAADEILQGGVPHERTGPNDVVTARILVPNVQVGCIIGKGGTVIQNLRSDTKASIRILPSDHLPPCAMESDELVQISGVSSIVRNALYQISTLLHQHPRKDYPPLEEIIQASTRGLLRPASTISPPLHHGDRMWSRQHSDVQVPAPVPWDSRYQDEPYAHSSGSLGRDTGTNNRGTAEVFSMKILCASGKIGGVIGKGGSNVRNIEQQTGACIKVEDSSPEAEERIIIISSEEALWDPLSPTIEALLQLQHKASSTSENGVITSRLLIPSSKVGCILGEGGNVITEMRRRTRADIRLFSKHDKPKYASGNEELVQISGNPDVARTALAEIASRLRERTLRAVNPAASSSSPKSFHGFPPECFYNRHLSPSPDRVAERFPAGHFHNFAPPESFSSRGLPSTSTIRLGNSLPYGHRENPARTYEAKGYMAATNTVRYPSFSNSPEVKNPNSSMASAYGAGGSNSSSTHQIYGARLNQQCPPSNASNYYREMHNSSDQPKSVPNLHYSREAPRNSLPSSYLPRPY